MPTVNGYDRCCKVSDTNTDNTGQICENGQFCYNGICYNGFEYDDTTKRCIPSTKTTSDIYKIYNTVDNCLSDKSHPMCNKNVGCKDWKICYCCPPFSTGEDSCQKIIKTTPFDYFSLLPTLIGKEIIDEYLFIFYPYIVDNPFISNMNLINGINETIQPIIYLKKDYPSIPYDICYVYYLIDTSNHIKFDCNLYNKNYFIEFDYHKGNIFVDWTIDITQTNKGVCESGDSCTFTIPQVKNDNTPQVQNNNIMNIAYQIGNTQGRKPTQLWLSIPPNPKNNESYAS